MVITLKFAQFNIACISEHTGVKVRLKKRWIASEIYIHYFDTVMFPWWQDVYLVHEKTCHSFPSQQRRCTIILVNLRPSLKNTLTRGLFYIPPPLEAMLRPFYNTLVYRWSYPRVKPMTWA